MQRNYVVQFVIMLGLVSLFTDMAYEGARSISGPFLLILGANATAVGFIAGFGEFIGYVLRLASGYVLDKTKRYWTICFLGYFINLLAIPIMAYAHHWYIAAVLIVLERAGKAIRTPSRDAMLSHAGYRIGLGWVFGLHEAMDRVGAMLGPLIVVLILYLQGHYQQAFLVLGLPAFFAILILFITQKIYPKPAEFESDIEVPDVHFMRQNYWRFLLAICFMGAGFVDFPLIAFHFQKSQIFSAMWIPLTYALAAAANSILAPVLGRLYDKIGFYVFFIASILAAIFPIAVFYGSFYWAVFGVLVWGIGVGIQASLVRAIIAKWTAKQERGFAYGVFNTIYGFSWFLGSFFMGYLYDINRLYLVVFSLLTQAIAIILLWNMRNTIK